MYFNKTGYSPNLPNLTLCCPTTTFYRLPVPTVNKLKLKRYDGKNKFSVVSTSGIEEKKEKNQLL